MLKQNATQAKTLHVRILVISAVRKGQRGLYIGAARAKPRYAFTFVAYLGTG